MSGPEAATDEPDEAPRHRQECKNERRALLMQGAECSSDWALGAIRLTGRFDVIGKLVFHGKNLG